MAAFSHHGSSGRNVFIGPATRALFKERQPETAGNAASEDDTPTAEPRQARTLSNQLRRQHAEFRLKTQRHSRIHSIRPIVTTRKAKPKTLWRRNSSWKKNDVVRRPTVIDSWCPPVSVHASVTYTTPARRAILLCTCGNQIVPRRHTCPEWCVMELRTA